MKIFSHLKHQIGNVKPQWFMSDDAEQFYSAWIAVFNKPRKLLCTWHIDRSWRRAISSMVKDQMNQVSLYHILRTLMEEVDETKFIEVFHSAANYIKTNEGFEQFLQYFENTYGNRHEQWALCYRKDAGMNTNTYTESFHRVLKYVYMKGRVNKRMDAIINLLIKYARDKAFDRLIKAEKGKSTKHITRIHKRHATSLNLSTSSVSKISENSWQVKSVSSQCLHIEKRMCNM